MAIVNYVNAFSNFLVPSVISFFGTPERALFWCGFSYLYEIHVFPDFHFLAFIFLPFHSFSLLCNISSVRFMAFFRPSCGLAKESFLVITHRIMIEEQNQDSFLLYTC